MKNFLLSLGIMAFFSSFINISFVEIINAVKSGNATEVAKYFDNTVEITLPEKSNSYSKKQAQLVLQDFFTKNEVKNFEVIHQSESSGSQYCIGNLTTINGVFRTTIYMKQKGDKQLVQELRFEKEI
jgi:antitoxin component YwqK of YwqJK toxin-antitoxin module